MKKTRFAFRYWGKGNEEAVILERARCAIKRWRAKESEWSHSDRRKEQAVRLRESGLTFGEIGAALGVTPNRGRQLFLEGMHMRRQRERWGNS